MGPTNAPSQRAPSPGLPSDPGRPASQRRGQESGAYRRFEAIRWLTAAGPAFFLAWAIWIARGYPLTRAAHGRILEALARRDAGGRA